MRGGRLRVAALVVLAALVLVAAALRFWLNDTTTPVTIGDAVSAFREDVTSPTEPTAATTTPTTQQPMLPRPGVYAYATLGSEEVDALGGATHEYPATSPVLVRPHACGVALRWTALEERNEELTICRSGSDLTLTGYTSFHRFFGQDDRQVFDCTPAATLLSFPVTIGDRGTARCRADTLIEDLTIVLSGLDTMSIDRTTTEAARVSIEVMLDSTDGQTTGSGSIELWIHLESGTVLRWREHTSSVADSLVGDVRYEESFELELLSLEPST